jgi:hypothetical protein
MKRLSRLTFVHLGAFSLLLIVPAASAQQLPPVAKQVAKTYGLDSFGKIEAIRYTFTIEGLVSRTWNGTKDRYGFLRGQGQGRQTGQGYVSTPDLGSQSDAVKNQIDPAFVNDQYWLVLPCT